MPVSETRALLALARHRRLVKAQAQGMPRVPAAPRPKVGIDPHKQIKTPDMPAPGDFVRVMRPGMHQQPILARTVAAGRHGITVKDAEGHDVKVRHEHVAERYARPTPRERVDFANSMALLGVPTSVEDRFLKLDGEGRAKRRPSIDQLAMLDVLSTQYGVPVDTERVKTDATFDETQELLARFIDDPEGRVVPSGREAGSRDDPDEQDDD